MNKELKLNAMNKYKTVMTKRLTLRSGPLNVANSEGLYLRSRSIKPKTGTSTRLKKKMIRKNVSERSFNLEEMT